MANSSSKFSLPCDALSPTQISFSIFHTAGSKVGVGAKGFTDSESAWSPTSPLDCRLFSNLSNPFSVKSSRPSLQTGHKQQLDCSKVGLGIIISLANETKLNNEIPGKFQRKNIIFGPQVKTGILKFSKNNHESLASYLKSNSLPKNYVLSLPSETKSPKSEVESFDDVSRKQEFNWESEAFKSNISLPDSSKPSSLINTNQDSNLGNNDLFVENTSTVTSLPAVTSRSSQVDDSLKIKSSSLPISIDFTNGYVGSLSAREIELSEDYTCIISHGPNPKRTHIFGDCILEYHNNDFTEFSKKEEPAFKSSHVPAFSEGSAPCPLDNVLSFCSSCNKKLEEGEDIYIYRDEKKFCSFNCQSEEILEEEELEKTYTNSAESSHNSSYHDLFLTGLLWSK
ncbi:FCS-Like Zinc finger 11-like [Gastrolobium bilobum]|uniref:FCS-Like Zinc finger 11-like n=1 Tax=Gastrolobium bilobum TaxID=150636 RepID=UPI002AB17A07|nr:FCS-Like Zinc finger 11-like [Gastrolobium bilobum]